MEQLTYHEGNFSEGNPMIMGPLDQSFWFATMIFDGARAFDGCDARYRAAHESLHQFCACHGHGAQGNRR